ncbi:hypothetical protein [Microbulbifer variabilis]|uniref:hypothetical protein n=1 Tax=Microbulbifer variabilis TaxID=266805 RepID=UPI000375FCBC|nr:hypothetical protein [Microbulbifer variabilis]
MKAITLTLIILLSGCAAIDVSETDLARDLIGKCYEFREAGELLRTEGSDKERVMKFTWSYLFLSAESQDHHRESNGGDELVRVLEPGTQLKIRKVINYPYGSAGRCWIVKAELLNIDTKGEYVELPSCWVWDKPIWVYPQSPYELEHDSAKKLRIETPVLRASSCS